MNLLIQHIRKDSNSHEKVKTVKYLGSLVTNQNYFQEEIKYRYKAGIILLNIMFLHRWEDFS